MLKGLRHRRSGLSQTLAAFALLAMVVRALLPPGYMVTGPSADGQFATVTLCSIHGPIEVQIDSATGAVRDEGGAPVNQDRSANGDVPCVFAAVAHLAPPTLAPVTILVEFSAEVAQVAPLQLTPGRGLAAPPPWSTGPPLTT